MECINATSLHRKSGQGGTQSSVGAEGIPQRLKPNSLRSIYVRPEGRTLQENEFFAACLAPVRTPDCATSTTPRQATALTRAKVRPLQEGGFSRV
jgi:hypothetical protein